MKKKNENNLSAKYPYLVMWGQMMGSFSEYIERELQKAERLKAPEDVIYFKGDNPNEAVCFSSVTNPEVLHYFEARGLTKPAAREMSKEEEQAFQALDDNMDWMSDEQIKDAANQIRSKYKKSF